jgi:hypothetical protein
VSQSTGTGGRHGYASALADLWYALAQTLRRLEAIGADLPDEAAEQLPSLQYALHVASERIAGLDPPPGAAAQHEELRTALDEARDATAEVSDAFAHGGAQAALPLVWEWRGALFAVRLARQRLVQAPEQGPPTPSAPGEPRHRNETLVLGVLMLPLLAALGIAAVAGAEWWAILAACGVAVVLGLVLRRA